LNPESLAFSTSMLDILGASTKAISLFIDSAAFAVIYDLQANYL